MNALLPVQKSGPKTAPVSGFLWTNLALFILFCDTLKEALYNSVQILFQLEYLT